MRLNTIDNNYLMLNIHNEIPKLIKKAKTQKKDKIKNILIHIYYSIVELENNTKKEIAIKTNSYLAAYILRNRKHLDIKLSDNYLSSYKISIAFQKAITDNNINLINGIIPLIRYNLEGDISDFIKQGYDIDSMFFIRKTYREHEQSFNEYKDSYILLYSDKNLVTKDILENNNKVLKKTIKL